MYKNYNNFKKPKPKSENISKYKGYKQLAYLTKPRALIAIKFLTNDPDGWFIDKVNYRITSGEITSEDMIIEKDFEEWVQYLVDKGYERN